MKIGILGRTSWLLDAAYQLKAQGHKIVFVWTCRSEDYYTVHEVDFEKLAREAGCPYILSSKIDDHIDTVKNLGAELVISVNFINITPSYFRKLFKYGVINAHAGDLPRYRGNACPNWAILNGEEHVGLSIHEMVDELDAGPIYLKRFFPLTDNTYIGEVYDWLNRSAPEMFVEASGMIERVEKPVPQDSQVRTLRSYPRKLEDAKINWSSSAFLVLRIIRASSHPFAGAYCFLNGDTTQKVTIHRAEIVTPDFDFLAVDGQLCYTEGTALFIACGGQMVKLTAYCLNDLPIEESCRVIAKSLRNRLV